MRVGIIAEGQGDQAVISNILCAVFDIDSESIQLIRPSDGKDQTDLHHKNPDQFGNCSLVKQDCLERNKIRDFFNSPVDEGERLLVIHVDTAEIGRADAVLQSVRPPKPRTKPAKKSKKKAKTEISPVEEAPSVSPYTDTLRDRVIAEIDGWLEGEYKSQLRYAIAIEETESWVLALHVDHDTVECRDPKLRDAFAGAQAEKPRPYLGSDGECLRACAGVVVECRARSPAAATRRASRC